MHVFNQLYRISLLALTTAFVPGNDSSIPLKYSVVPLAGMLRLRSVVGHSQRLNNILFISGSQEAKTQHVVFFPGDVQNYRSKMELHFSNKKWIDWCYENTATLLASQFPKSWIWIIEPTSMHEETFSCYENFITGDLLRAPENFENHDALLHLQSLLKSAVDLVNGYSDEIEHDQVCRMDSTCENVDKTVESNRDNLALDLPLVLVGKGCVVLNQFLFELKDAMNSPDLNRFVQNLNAWYWLDGGHSNDSNTWIIDEDVLQDLTKLKTEINVLVTPYQMKDKNRMCIGEEERLFVDTLKNLGADVKEIMYFEDEERSLENHFKVLEKISDASSSK